MEEMLRKFQMDAYAPLRLLDVYFLHFYHDYGKNYWPTWWNVVPWAKKEPVMYPNHGVELREGGCVTGNKAINKRNKTLFSYCFRTVML